MKKIEHLPVNWVNGLKLNNGHFLRLIITWWIL